MGNTRIFLDYLAQSGASSNYVIAWNGTKWAPAAVAVPNGDYGDISISGGVWSIDAATVTLAKMANLAANSFIGNNTGSAATPIALTVAQAKSLLALTKSDVGLANVDNTSDANKPVSIATQAALDTKVGNSLIGAASGVASLGSDGKVPSEQLPAIALTDVFTVASQAAQLALSAQEGDVAIRTDEGKTYIHNGGTAATMADWSELTSGGAVASVNGMTGAVTVTKTHVGLGNVDNTSDANKPVSTAQQTALDGKQNLDGTLTALAGASWTAGSQVLTLSAADTVTLVTVGQASGNILNKAAGDALYQSLDATLTALAGLNSTAGLVEQTGADAFTKRLIGVANATDVLTRADGDGRYALTGHNHSATYQGLDATLTALAALDTTVGVVEQTGTDTFTKRAIGVGSSTSLPTRADADARYALATTNWAPVTATGTGSSQNITLPESGLAPKDVIVNVDGMTLLLSDYSIVGSTLTLTTTATAEIEVRKLNAVSSLGLTSWNEVISETLVNSAITSSIPFDATIPQIGEGTEVMNATLTPTSATSRIRVEAHLKFGNAGGAAWAAFALFVNGVADAVDATAFYLDNAGSGGSVTLVYEYVPGSTSAQTYSVRCGNGIGARTININSPGNVSFGGSAKSKLIATELVSAVTVPLSTNGTVFPSAPAVGQRYFRTDRGIEYYWDGTRWLSTQIHSLNFNLDVNPAADYSTYSAIPFKGQYDIYLERLDISGWRSATGEWDVLLQTATGTGTYNTIITVDGSAAPTTTWYAGSTTHNAVLTSAVEGLRLTIDEVSGSATFIGAANLTYRLVG